MMIIPPSITSIQGDMLQHAFAEAPKEACGLVVNGKYVPCQNVHEEPEKYFTICPKAYAKACKKGEVEAIFHSHTTNYNKFSPSDARSCKQSNVPWVMYCTVTDDWHYADPTGNAPYVGRQWHYGIHDCYSLLKDFHHREFGIELADFQRGEEMEWDSPDWNMFEQNFADQGFVSCDDSPKKGDMILMQLQAPKPNHVGVMVEPDTNIFYHHLLDRLSEANIYGGYWEKATNKILRHKEFL
jgi:proteasome lid subunit RPN8/RPN11